MIKYIFLSFCSSRDGFSSSASMHSADSVLIAQDVSNGCAAVYGLSWKVLVCVPHTAKLYLLNNIALYIIQPTFFKYFRGNIRYSTLIISDENI